MTVHYFDSTGEAYDMCQCDENIKTGDTLVVMSEGVVGLAWAWPVAITRAHGKLHSLVAGSSALDLKESPDNTGVPVFSTAQVIAAEDEAGKHGFALGGVEEGEEGPGFDDDGRMQEIENDRWAERNYRD
jgi:hypothetical protein